MIKCRQQLHVEKFQSISEVMKNIYKTEGIKGFYRGLIISFHRDVYSFGVYFFVYHKLKDYWQEKLILTDFKLMIAGGISGALTWTITYPADTIKTIIQSDHNKKSLTIKEAYYINAKETNRKVFGLFKGLTPTIFRGFFVNAVIFYTNEYLHRIFD